MLTSLPRISTVRIMSIDRLLQYNSQLVLSESDRVRFIHESIVKNVSKSSYFIRPGNKSVYLPFVYSGSFKVYKLAENGREITLYRIEKGESCIISALSIINSTPFPATVQSETNSEVLLIPAGLVLYLVEHYPEWRNYIFSMYNNRFDKLLALIDEVLFRKLDIRLSAFLLEQADSTGSLRITHREIADDLGSRREVISRILKDMEQQGLVELERARIILKDIAGLSKKSALR